MLSVDVSRALQRINSTCLSWPRPSDSVWRWNFHSWSWVGVNLRLKITSLLCNIIICICNIYQGSTIGQALNQRKIYTSRDFCLWWNYFLKIKERNWKYTHIELFHKVNHFALNAVSLLWKILKMGDNKVDPSEVFTSMNKEIIVQCFEISPNENAM